MIWLWFELHLSFENCPSSIMVWLLMHWYLRVMPLYLRSEPTHSKHWWSEEINELKQKSIDSHHMWIESGKPRYGAIFDIYKSDKYAYKLSVKKAKSDADFTITNELHEALCSKRNDQFWKIWKSKFNTNKNCKPKLINGLIDSNQISEGFSNYFGGICKPNSNVYNETKCDEFNSKLRNYAGDFLNINDLFTIELISKIICELKTGRAPGLDGLTTEHLLNCHPSAHLLITLLCNLILVSGHVPAQFHGRFNLSGWEG